MAVILKGNDKATGRTVEVTHETIVVRAYLRAPVVNVRVVPAFRGIIQTYVLERIVPWDVPHEGDQNYDVVIQKKTELDALSGNFILQATAYETGQESGAGEEVWTRDDLLLSLINEGTDYGLYSGPPIASGFAKVTMSLLRVPEES